MKYNDLSFNVVSENGIEMINDITNVIPNNKNSDEPYVIFTDYTLDSDDEFIKKYGKLVQDGDEYYLETNLSAEEIDYINNNLNEEIVKYVNDTIEESLNE